MPAVILPAIASALTLSATATTVFTAVGTVAMSVGMGYLGQKLFTPSAPRPTPGIQQNMAMRSDVPRSIVIGSAAPVAGSMHYWQFSGNNNKYLEMVIVLSDWPSGNIGNVVYIDSRPVTLNSDGTIGSTWLDDNSTCPMHNHVRIRYHNGDWDQAADAQLVANSGGALDSKFRLAGCAYVVVRLTYSQKVFPGGIPRFLFIMEGAKLYDFRKDSTVGGSGTHRWDNWTTWEVTDNPVVVHYNWRRGLWYNGHKLYGMSAPAFSLPVGAFASAANYCDELVQYYTDNTHTTISTEKRYTVNGMIDTSVENRAIISALMMSYSGRESDIGGAYKPVVGAQSIVADITDDDVIVDEEFTYSPNRAGSDVINSVYGSFIDPKTVYQTTDLPPRINLSDLNDDGGAYSTKIDFGLVTSMTQAQRLMEIQRRLYRKQKMLSFQIGPRLSGLEVGDWVTVTLDSEGINGGVFEVVDTSVTPEPKTPITLREIGSDVFAWTLADQLLKNAMQYVADGTPAGGSITGLNATAITVSASASISRPGINATWTPPTDETISSILFEYRVQGSTTALTKTSYSPDEGEFEWVDGVQANVRYEVRCRPLTVPDRATDWTAWQLITDPTSSQVVSSAVITTSVTEVAPDTVGINELTPQARLELSLMTATAEIAGSVQQQIDDLAKLLERVGNASLINVIDNATNAQMIRHEETARKTESEAFTQQLDAAVSRIDDAEAAILSEATTRATADSAATTQINNAVSRISAAEAAIASEAITRATADSASATQISTLTSRIGAAETSISTETSARISADNAEASARTTLAATVGGHTTRLDTAESVIAGYGAKWTIQYSVDGYVAGAVSLNGAGSYSTFAVLAYNFVVAQPGVSGGDPRQVFTIGTNTAGVPSLVFNGNFFTNGSIHASALIANSLTTLYISDPTDTYYYDFANGKDGTTDGTFLIDRKNKRIRIGA